MLQKEVYEALKAIVTAKKANRKLTEREGATNRRTLSSKEAATFCIVSINNETSAAVKIAPSPFLFPFTAQITEGRPNWVTSEIVYCYRLVCAHATYTHTNALWPLTHTSPHNPPIQFRASNTSCVHAPLSARVSL